ncbi:MAG: adenosine deaminase, partial [Pseudomonadota bacterium]|nr:adenosine deaminase [Pseudomonadota bacterium]
QLLALKGIGPWTVSYLMLRAYSQPDEWLGTDLGVIKSLQSATSGLSPEQLQQQIERWSPWRSYAVIALWQLMENS